jgi:hypothetical protein
VQSGILYYIAVIFFKCFVVFYINVSLLAHVFDRAWSVCGLEYTETGVNLDVASSMAFVGWTNGSSLFISGVIEGS